MLAKGGRADADRFTEGFDGSCSGAFVENPSVYLADKIVGFGLWLFAVDVRMSSDQLVEKLGECELDVRRYVWPLAVFPEFGNFDQ